MGPDERPRSQSLARMWILGANMVHREHFVAGRDGCSRIDLVNDGLGPMGYYDRIHVELERETIIYPAHLVSAWSVWHETGERA